MSCELRLTSDSASSEYSANPDVFFPSSELGSGKSMLVVLVPKESKHGACVDASGKIKWEVPPPPVLRSLKRGSAASRRSRMKRQVIMAVRLHVR